MKVKLKLLFAALCGLFATTAVFGQNTFVWTNSAGGDISVAANWTNAATGANGVPSSGTADILEFNGASSGPVFATANLGVGTQSGGGTRGMNLWITGNQSSSVTIGVTVANALAPYSRFDSITVDSGAGTFNFGNPSTTNGLQFVWGNANPLSHGLTNNSANPAIIWPNVAWRAGGGGNHTFQFAGTGIWSVTNDIIMDNSAGSRVEVEGPGTLVWTAGHTTYSLGNSGKPSSPFAINGGTAILKSPTLIVDSACPTINNNGTLLEWDLETQSQTYGGTINGTGNLQVNSGTLTLGSGGSGGQNTYTGNTILSGGELFVNSAENFGASGPLGNGGMISFTGGTLGFSSVNSYDYSPRFTNSSGQAYSFDTAGQSVTFTNALTSSGGTLTKLGSGTLTLAGANTYSGLTAVSAGKLLIQGSQGSGGITVANSAILGITGLGPQIAPSTLTVGTSGSAILEFNNVSSTTTAPLAVAGTVSVGGPITINVPSGSFLTGQHYPLLSFSGTPPGVTLGTLTGAGGNLSTNGNTIQLNITSLAFVWTGNNNGNWDTTTANNWKVNGVAQIFANGGTALFDDTVSSANTNVTFNAPVSPASTTVSSSTKTYTMTSSGANVMSGGGSLTKNGNSTLTLSGGVNTFSGATILSGGTVSVSTLANGSSASDIGAASSSAANLVFNGGTLQYTGGGATSDHLFTLGTAGGTIDNEGGQLTLNNSGVVVLSGTGARTLILNGSDTSGDTLAATLGDNGGATALTKSGAGTWIVTGNNTNSGTVTINAGTLQVGAGASGSIGSGNVINQGILDFNIAGTVTNGAISGAGSVIVDGTSTVVLPGNSSYSGGTTINPSATLQLGTGGATGSLIGNRAIVDDGLLIFNTTGTFIYNGAGAISGGGNVIVRGGGLIEAFGNNTYTGWTEIDPGTTFQPTFGLSGNLTSSLITNNGTLLCPIQDYNGSSFTFPGAISGSGKLVTDAATGGAIGTLHLTGDCTYTGGTIIQQSEIIVGDGSVSGSLSGDVTFTNSAYGYEGLPRLLHFNRSDDVTFSGSITGPGGTLVGGSRNNAGQVVQDGSGTLTLTANNTYLAGTVINAGTLQVGNGGTSGDIGSGPVSDSSVLVWKRSDSVAFTNTISGSGSFVQFGSGTLTLSGALSYSGSTTVSNGTLVVSGGAVGGDVNIEGGAFVPASFSAGGTLSVAGNMTIDAGNILVPLNKSLSVTNIVVAGTLTRNGGTLLVTNVGPSLAVNDKFYLFSQPVSGFTPTGAGATWQNDLAVDGSITALTVPATVNTNHPVMQVSITGNTLNLAWPTNRGWTLLTNSVGLTAANQWFPYPGSASLTNVSITINPAKTNVFFRMVYTNTP